MFYLISLPSYLIFLITWLVFENAPWIYKSICTPGYIVKGIVHYALLYVFL